MSLATDSIFIAAIGSNPELMAKLGYITPEPGKTGKPARLYSTAIPLPDEDVDNVPVPYLIVTFDGLNNDLGTKDNLYESDYDKVNIGVEVVGKSLADLHQLTQMVRDTIVSYFRENITRVEDYLMTADAIQFDSLKPCYWQVLRYQCDVCNIHEEDEQEG